MCIDESVNGKTVYTGLWTNEPSDVLVYPEKKFNKKRILSSSQYHLLFEYDLKGRDFSFLTLRNEEFHQLNKRLRNKDNHKIPGVVIMRLISRAPLGDNLKIFFDGDVFGQFVYGNKYVIYTRDLVSEVSGLARDSVEIRSEADFDRRVWGVNLADHIAYWMGQRGFAKLYKDPRNKPLSKF